MEDCNNPCRICFEQNPLEVNRANVVGNSPGWKILPTGMAAAPALTFTAVSGMRMTSFLIRVDGGEVDKRSS